VFEVLNGKLNGELARLERIINADLPRINAALRAAGVPEITRSKVELPASTKAGEGFVPDEDFGR
jgi:hypothetical protein